MSTNKKIIVTRMYSPKMEDIILEYVNETRLSELHFNGEVYKFGVVESEERFVEVILLGTADLDMDVVSILTQMIVDFFTITLISPLGHVIGRKNYRTTDALDNGIVFIKDSHTTWYEYTEE